MHEGVAVPINPGALNSSLVLVWTLICQGQEKVGQQVSKMPVSPQSLSYWARKNPVRYQIHANVRVLFCRDKQAKATFNCYKICFFQYIVSIKTYSTYCIARYTVESFQPHNSWPCLLEVDKCSIQCGVELNAVIYSTTICAISLAVSHSNSLPLLSAVAWTFWATYQKDSKLLSTITTWMSETLTVGNIILK